MSTSLTSGDASLRLTVREPPRRAEIAETEKRHGIWFHYGNARLWGKTFRESIQYAREAAVEFD